MEAQKIKNKTIYKNLYVVDELISCNESNSETYLAHYCSNLNNKIVIKVIYKMQNDTNEFWQNMINKAIANQRLKGKVNIVDTFDTWIENDKIFIVMEYVNGITLKKYLNENGTIPPKSAINVFLKILKALKFLQDSNQQITNWNLKPENIIVDKNLSITKLNDFGISSVIQKTYNTISNSNEIKYLSNEEKNEIYATYPYVSPYITNSKQFDYFSLGIILFEMVMGKLPFYLEKDEEKINIIKKPLKYDMPCISSSNSMIPIELENIIFQCIACKKEDEKYQYKNIDQIINDCHQLLNNWQVNKAKLLKPIKLRILQDYNVFNIEKIKLKQQFYKKWYFFFVLSSLVIFIIICIIFMKKNL